MQTPAHPNEPPEVLCVGYVRVSTDHQALSLEAQRQQIESYSRFRPGLRLLQIFQDEDVSAESVPFLQRPAALEMLTAMPALQATAIVVAKLDRGFRDELDALFTAAQLREQGIDLHMLDFGGAIVDTSSAAGMLIFHTMVGVSCFEQRRRRERVLEAGKVMDERRMCRGVIPYGCNLASGSEGKSGYLVDNPAEQEILYRLLRGDLKDHNHSAAARQLNQEGVPSKKGGQLQKGKTVSGLWYASSVKSVRETGQLSQATIDAHENPQP